MNKELYDALEYCLHAIEDGASPDAVLARYPRLAGELRPLIEAAYRARTLGVSEPPADAVRRGRMQLLQRTAQMRPSPRRSNLRLVQRFAFTLALTAVFLMSGTGLVRASSSTLPGDNLYPVKRTWEDVRLLFVFAPGQRQALSGEFEQERLDEVAELLQKGRVVSITFTGLITSQKDGEIIVSGVPVAISNQTQFSGTQAVVGASVIVVGQTDTQGRVTALQVQVLPPGTVVPVGVPETLPGVNSGPTNGPVPTPETQSEAPSAGEDSSAGRNFFHLDGTVQSMQGNIWIVDGKSIDVNQAQFNAIIQQGSEVQVEGYFAPDGRFVATTIQLKDSGGDSHGTGGDQTPEGEHPTEVPDGEHD